MASNTSLGQETKKLNQNQLQVPNVPNPMDGSNPSFKQLNSSMVSGQKITCPHFTSNTLPKISCFEHPDQYLTNFCKSEKCLFPLCPQCVTQHVTEHFEDKSQPKLDSLENVLNQICSVIFDQANQLQQCFCSIQNSVCQAKVQDDSLIKKLNDIRQRIIKIVDQHFNALENELKNKQSKNFSNYNRDADSFVKLLQDRFDSHISFLERMKQTDCMRIVIPFYRSTVLQDNKLYFAMAQDYAQKYQQFSSEITFDPMKSSQMGNYLNSFIQVVNYDLPEFLDIHKLAASDITTSTKKVTSSQASSRVQSKQSISSGKKVQFEQNQPPSFHNSVAGSQRFNQSLQNIGSRKT